MKRLFCLAFAVSMLCGCMDTVQLNERAVVQAIGIDAQGEGLLLSMQVFEPFGGEEAAGGKVSCKIVQVSGKNVSEALQSATLKQGKEIFYGHNKLIVVGRELAQRGIEDVVRFFNTDRQSRPNVDIMMADRQAGEVISAQLQGSMLPVLTAQMMLENYQTSGMLLRARVRDLAQALENPALDTFLPVVRLNAEDEENPAIEVSATAVLSRNRLAGELTQEETRGLLWLLGEVRRTQITLKDHQGASLLAAGKGRVIRPRIEDGRPYFTIRLKVQSTVAEPLGNDEGPALEEKLSKYSEAQSRQIEEELCGTLEKLTRQLRADPVGFSNYLAKYEPDFWSREKDRYRELLSEMEFEIRIESDIDRAGLA